MVWEKNLIDQIHFQVNPNTVVKVYRRTKDQSKLIHVEENAGLIGILNNKNWLETIVFKKWHTGEWICKQAIE